jgi:hypothetical protein
MPARLFTALTFCLILGSAVHAHQVPNMTVEAAFAADGGFEIKVNLDPRVFLSDNPASLPPVPASWYLDQTEDQRRENFQQATSHVGRMLKFQLGRDALKEPAINWQAMDGATSLAVTADTAETHLLGTLRGVVPEGADSFTLEYARDGQVSLILLTTTPGMTEPKVQVLFAGEASRPVAVPAGRPAPEPETQAQRSHGPAALALVVLLAVIAVAGFRRLRARR